MNGTTAGTGALVLAATFWAASVSGTKEALGGFGAVTLLGVELIAAAIALWAIVLARRQRRQRVPWRYAIVLGVLEPAVAYLGDTLGLQRTGAANASLLEGAEAVFVVVLAAVFLRERVTVPACAAVAVGLAGLAVVASGDGLTRPGVGDLLILAGALSAAGYTIVARRGAGVSHDGRAVDPLALTAQQFVVAAVVTVPCVLTTWVGGYEPVPRHVAARYWLVAAGVGVIGLAASFLLYNWAVARVQARTSAVILNLIPVFGLVCARVWLGERLSVTRLAGGALITVSVAVFAWIERRGAVEPEAVEPVPAGVRAPAVPLPQRG